MRWRPLGRGLALSTAVVAAALALAGGDVRASGLVNVRITPNTGVPGTKIDVAASGFDDQHTTTSATPTHWAEIGIDSTTVAPGAGRCWVRATSASAKAQRL